jgi:hypothetical protein
MNRFSKMLIPKEYLMADYEVKDLWRTAKVQYRCPS